MNDTVKNTIAPLHNVALLNELVYRVKNRDYGLPGMATFYGFSGYGKTFAAIYAANKHKAYHVQVKSVWTPKKLCTSILGEMGIQPAYTIPDMMDQIGEELSLSQRPLIIDEADYLVQKRMVEVVRDIYESSQATIILIGEEAMPAKLQKWERVHGRMLDWVAAQPASIEDVKHLTKLYANGIAVEQDLCEKILKESAGSVRRVCVNLDRVREFAVTKGLKSVCAGDYQRDFFTGVPPMARKAGL